RPERPGDEPRLVGRFRSPPVRAFARDAGRGAVHLGHAILETIIRLRDSRRAERVRFGNVGARREIGIVNVAHDIGTRQYENIVVTLEVAAVIMEAAGGGSAKIRFAELSLLDHRAPRAVEDQDTFAQKARKLGGAIG